MKIEVNYAYKREFMPTAKSRKKKSMAVNHTYEIEIKEVTEFPVAFRTTKPQSVVKGAKTYNEFNNKESEYIPFTEEIREYDGRLFRLCRVKYGAAISTEPEEPSSLKKRLTYDMPEKWAWNDGKDLFTSESTILSDNRDVVFACLRRKAEKYVIYDGLLWAECGEPVYRKMVTTSGDYIDIQYVNNLTPLDPDQYFSLDFDKPEGCNCNIEVLMPEMVNTIKAPVALEYDKAKENETIIDTLTEFCCFIKDKDLVTDEDAARLIYSFLGINPDKVLEETRLVEEFTNEKLKREEQEKAAMDELREEIQALQFTRF